MKGRGWGGLEASARPELVGVEGLGGAVGETDFSAKWWEGLQGGKKAAGS